MFDRREPSTYSLPASLPQWPQGEGSFNAGIINLGELEVKMVKQLAVFNYYYYYFKKYKTKSIMFYGPQSIPDGFFLLGHSAQPSSHRHLGRSCVLVARNSNNNLDHQPPPLMHPVGFDLIFKDTLFVIWRPRPPPGYRALGFIVTTLIRRVLMKPKLSVVMCVREDLTQSCQLGDDLCESYSKIKVFNTKPFRTGMFSKGVPVGTFVSALSDSDFPHVGYCLRNLNPNLEAMPNLEQVEALMQHYGPILYFHPDEVYFPSSVPWFFKKGAKLFKKGKSSNGIPIHPHGTNLPQGGTNDGSYWLDLPPEDVDDIKHGNLESAQLYIHVKPAFAGTFTDIDMWFFCPYKGPVAVTLTNKLKTKIKVGKHIGNWEHFTLRISNFNGELYSVYFSGHSGGKWVDASHLKFFKGNKPIVYSAKGSHATFPNAGTCIKGLPKLGIGLKMQADVSNQFIDASNTYHIVAAEYLGGVVEEPDWLQYMRVWGPTVSFDWRPELKKSITYLPFLTGLMVKKLVHLFPYKERRTGPKERLSWFGDEQ
uniref:uncharacterized protein LOC122593518 n=1 Tax=Erigeron canadensis TaxID=72917 RepID=UPI001CB9B8F0|nr:uncharacterized protein LOC122593518 [Erigeron canadensis]